MKDLDMFAIEETKDEQVEENEEQGHRICKSIFYGIVIFFCIYWGYQFIGGDALFHNLYY